MQIKKHKGKQSSTQPVMTNPSPSARCRIEADQDFASRLGHPSQSCTMPSKMLKVMHGSEMVMPTQECSGVDLRDRIGSFHSGSSWTYTYHPSSNSQQIRVVDCLGATILPVDIGHDDEYDGSHLKDNANIEVDLKYFMAENPPKLRKSCKRIVSAVIKRVVTSRHVEKS